jgi:hypothetical protein
MLAENIFSEPTTATHIYQPPLANVSSLANEVILEKKNPQIKWRDLERRADRILGG